LWWQKINHFTLGMVVHMVGIFKLETRFLFCLPSFCAIRIKRRFWIEFTPTGFRRWKKLQDSDKGSSIVRCNIIKQKLDWQLYSWRRRTAKSARFLDKNLCVQNTPLTGWWGAAFTVQRSGFRPLSAVWVALDRTVARKFSIGGLFDSAGGLEIIKLTKTPLIYSVSRFNLGAWNIVWGTKPTKVPPCRRDWPWIRHFAYKLKLKRWHIKKNC